MRRLLVVDDEPAIGRLVQRVAEGCGYTVTVTQNSDEFLTEMKAGQPDAIVMDLSLPGLDGIDLLRVLGAAGCRAEILIISGFDPRVLETSGKLGTAQGLNIVGTITKPARIAELRAVIGALGQREHD